MNALKTAFISFVQLFQLLKLSFSIKKFQIKKNLPPTETWVMQAVDDPAFLLRFYHYLKSAVKAGHSPQVLWLNTKINFKKNKRFQSTLMDSFTQGRLYLFFWKLIYQNLYLGTWYQYLNLKISPEQKILARKHYDSLSSKEQLERLVIDEVWVGDLIYDTYLRFKPAPTADLKDPFLNELIEYSVALVPFLENLLAKNKVSRVVVSYATYLQHGMLTRVALKEGIYVNSMGSFNQLIVEPTHAYPYQRRNFLLYREMAKELKNHPESLEIGKKTLENRLSGKMDTLTSYMKKSAYEDNGVELASLLGDQKLDSRPKVLLMGHDFYDSPHLHGEMLYPDFLTWMDACLSHSKDSPYQFLVKPHPNSVSDESEIISEFKKKYPQVIFLPKEVSNQYVKKLDISYVLTTYGTVTYEFASMGFTVLCCGENPHQAYNFSVLVKNREELSAYLTGKSAPKISIDLNEIYEFIFVHNYRLEKGELKLFPALLPIENTIAYLEDDEKRSMYMDEAFTTIDRL